MACVYSGVHSAQGLRKCLLGGGSVPKRNNVIGHLSFGFTLHHECN